MGLAGAMITVYPREEKAYDLPEYEPLWAAAQDLGPAPYAAQPYQPSRAGNGHIL